MTREQFYEAIDNPDQISAEQADALAQMVRRFPYFHAGWMLLAKGLAVSGSVHFSSELKKASVHVWDRGALFWLVNGRPDDPARLGLKPRLPKPKRRRPEPDKTADESPAPAAAQVQTPEPTPAPQVKPAATLLSPVEPVSADYFPGADDDLGLDSANDASALYSLADFDDQTRRPAERYTFADWLDYVSERQTIKDEEVQQDRHAQQNKLIDRFLEEPVERITPSVSSRPISQSEAKAIEERSVSENDDILTETLASIYLKQKKFDKAINIFKKLSLKYPEKSSYFASRIDDIQRQVH